MTILMNSFRIGTIGVMVEHWGQSMAEGFLHDFQGWAVFMTSAGLLLLEMMVLASIGKHRRPWREVFGLDAAEPINWSATPVQRTVPAPFITGDDHSQCVRRGRDDCAGAQRGDPETRDVLRLSHPGRDLERPAQRAGADLSGSAQARRLCHLRITCAVGASW